MAFRRPDPLIREKLNRAFATLGFNPMEFDPKDTKPLKTVVRQWSCKLHPDRNPKDVENATRKFQNIQEAYNLIMDNLDEAGKCAIGGECPKAAAVWDERVEKNVLEDLAGRGSWSGIIVSVKNRFGESSELGKYAISLLDSGVKEMMAIGHKSHLEFLCMNTGSKEVRVAIMKWFETHGEAARADAIIKDLAEQRKWNAVAHCAGASGLNGLGSYASSLLEDNAASVVASGQRDAMLFLRKKANLAWVRQAALDGLAKAGDPDAIRVALDGMAQRKEWQKIIATGMGLPESQADLKRHSVALLERNLEEVLKSATPDVLMFLWDRLSSDRTRMRIVDWLVDAGDYDSVKRLMGDMEQNGRWAEILRTYSRVPPGHSELRNFTLSLLERNTREVIESGETDALVFIYNNSKDGNAGHVIFAGLAESGNFAGARELLAVMAGKGRWNEIKEEASMLPESRLRAHAEALLEKNSKHVIASGRLDVIEFMCRSAGSGGTVVASLKGVSGSGDRFGSERILDIMAERRMWKEMKEAASRNLAGDGELRDYSLSLLEANVDGVIDSGRTDVILFLWENAKSRGIRDRMLEGLATAGNTAAVKPMLAVMAQKGMWRGLTYCAKDVFAGRPEMRRYALSLMEDNVGRVIDAGAGDALDFLRQNTMKARVLDSIYGKPEQPGVFRAAVRKARDVWDRLPVVGSA